MTQRIRRNRSVPRFETFEDRTMLSGMGVNVAFNTSWDGEAVWTNVSRLMGRWNYVGADWMKANPSVETNALASPLTDASSYVTLVNYPDGVYQVSFKGTAKVDFVGVGRLVGALGQGERRRHPGPGPGRRRQGRQRRPTRPDHERHFDRPDDPLAQLKIIAPGYPADGSQEFTNEFLQDLRPFDDVRFLNWELTNNSSLAHWDDRADRDQLISSYDSKRPIDYETMIELGNEAHKDIWLNVPTRADDDFVRRLADLVRDKLDPGLKVYIEYSNETWNQRSQAYSDVLAAARANPLVTATNDIDRVAEQSAFRLKGISDTFRQEFGSGFDRVVPVFGGWSDLPGTDPGRPGFHPAELRRSFPVRQVDGDRRLHDLDGGIQRAFPDPDEPHRVDEQLSRPDHPFHPAERPGRRLLRPAARRLRSRARHLGKRRPLGGVGGSRRPTDVHPLSTLH